MIRLSGLLLRLLGCLVAAALTLPAAEGARMRLSAAEDPPVFIEADTPDGATIYVEPHAEGRHPVVTLTAARQKLAEESVDDFPCRIDLSEARLGPGPLRLRVQVDWYTFSGRRVLTRTYLSQPRRYRTLPENPADLCFFDLAGLVRDFRLPEGSAPVTFTLPWDAVVSVLVADDDGRPVRRLLEAAPLPKGTHTIPWDYRDDAQHPVTATAATARVVYHPPLTWKRRFFAYTQGERPAENEPPGPVPAADRFRAILCLPPPSVPAATNAPAAVCVAASADGECTAFDGNGIVVWNRPPLEVPRKPVRTTLLHHPALGVFAVCEAPGDAEHPAAVRMERLPLDGHPQTTVRFRMEPGTPPEPALPLTPQDVIPFADGFLLLDGATQTLHRFAVAETPDGLILEARESSYLPGAERLLTDVASASPYVLRNSRLHPLTDALEPGAPMHPAVLPAAPGALSLCRGILAVQDGPSVRLFRPNGSEAPPLPLTDAVGRLTRPPAGLAFDAAGTLWLCEARTAPLRLSRWQIPADNPPASVGEWTWTGRAVEVGGFPAFDIPFRSVLHNALWRLLPGGAAKLLQELQPAAPAPGSPPVAARFYRPFPYHGRQFFVGVRAGVTTVYEYRNRECLRPVALFGTPAGLLEAANVAQLPSLSDRAHDATSLLCWSDLNNDGLMQEAELQVAPPEVSCRAFTDGWALSGWSFLLPIRLGETDALLALEPVRWTDAGVPLYDLAAAVASAQPLPAAAAALPFRAETLRSGLSLPERAAFAVTADGLCALTPAGARQCHASATAILGETLLPVRTVPAAAAVFAPEVVKAPPDDYRRVLAVLNGRGSVDFITEDGLLLGREENPCEGPSADAFLRGGCVTGCRGLYKPMVLLTAEHGGALYELIGSDELRETRVSVPQPEARGP